MDEMISNRFSSGGPGEKNYLSNLSYSKKRAQNFQIAG